MEKVETLMCGRYTDLLTRAQIVDLYEITSDEIAPNDFRTSYNVAPTQRAAIVCRGEKSREATLLRWGLIPAWAKDKSVGYKMINARAEGIATKPAFRSALKARRCLEVASGFYEWQKTASGKQAYWIGFADRRPFAFAGLWEAWTDRASGERIETYAIITTEPNALCAPIHNRMPVILGPADYDRWLTAEAPPEDLLRPFPADVMEAYPVSTWVNMPAHNDMRCIEPLRSQ
jgi:putative SOS response-associated peptidase YedK